MKTLPNALYAAALLLLTTATTLGCSGSRSVATPAPEGRAPMAGTPAASAAAPYRGALSPDDAPLPGRAGGPALAPAAVAALAVLYERPSGEGPPAVPVPAPKAIYAEGRGAVIQVLPGDLVYAEHLPAIARTALPSKGPFSNHVVQMREGSIRFVAVDRTLNDTKLSRDSMALDLSFTDAQGDRWRIVQASLAPLSPDPVGEPWFGGVGTNVRYHGESGQGTPAESLVNCVMCSWGWADIFKNDEKVQSAAPLHIMLTGATRAGADKGFAYQCYDCTGNPVREIHVVVAPEAALPTPGGFLHVMWMDAEWREGTPEEILASVPTLEEPMPTITLRAVPYLNWSEREIHLEAGRRYRLVLENDDPVAEHAFMAHMTLSEPGMADGPEADAAGYPGPEDLPSASHKIHVPLPHGSQWATTVKFSEPGEYHFGCPVMNHEARGMHGKFVVSAPTRR